MTFLRAIKSHWLFLPAVFALLALVAGWAWAFSSPQGSSPDDNYHLDSIWCPPPVEVTGCQWVAGPDGSARQIAVPASLVGATCYAYKPADSGACVDATEPGMTWTDRFDKGDYPGPYYRIMHVFASEHIGRSVLMMRIANVLVAVILIGGASLSMIPTLRPVAGIGVSATVVPLGAFVIASVNPSSWAVSGIVGATLGLLAGFTADRTSRRVGGGVVALLGAAVAAVARADSGIFLVMVLAALGILFLDRLRRDLRAWFAPVGVALAALWSQTHGAQNSSQFGAHAHPISFSLFFHNLADIPAVAAGVFGLNWGLGWLDTKLPSMVFLPALMSVAVLVTVGLASLSVRKVLALSAPLAGCLLLPLVRLQLGGEAVGEAIQPRYLLASVMVFVLILLVDRSRESTLAFTRRQAFVVVVMLSVANAVALSTNIRRYVTGDDVWSPNLDAGREWWWPSGPGPNLTLAIGALAFSALVVGVWWRSLRAPGPTPDRAAE